MKTKFILLAVAVAMLSSCKKEEVTAKIDPYGTPVIGMTPTAPGAAVVKRIPPKDGKYPAITFEKTEHDFGTIKSGDRVNTIFSFTNSGEADLIISSAVGSCGCTVPDYPKQPIKVGEKGEIKVAFNSSGKHGKQAKTVTLTTNTEAGQEQLTIKSSIE